MSHNTRIFLLIASLVVITGAILYLQGQKPVFQSALPIGGNISKSAGKITYDRAKEITDPAGFINTTPFALKDIIGKKVILLDFWTYSCINCQRTTPYLNAWYEKYRDQGLEIVGVHTPEFSFEKKYENVQAAVKKMGIKYPVVLDNNNGTWDAYQNLYWPEEYLIDIDGFIVYKHAGEGEYDKTEEKIQQLLEERASALHFKDEVTKDMATPKNLVNIDYKSVKSPETYFGAMRNEFLANGKKGTEGVTHFTAPASAVEPNQLYLEGDWDIQHEFAQNKSKDAKIVFRYQAKNVYIVASAKKPITVRVIQDGKPQAPITISAEKLYTIIQGNDYGDHTLELIVGQPDLSAFTLTFG